MREGLMMDDYPPRQPERGLTGITGTPASSAPATATHVSIEGSAISATRPWRATAAAIRALTAVSCA